MALNIPQQINELINKANNVLVVTRDSDNGDGVSSALALGGLLAKTNKPFGVIVQEDIKNKFSFLPKADELKTEIGSLKKFIISLDISKNKLAEFNYDIKDDKLNIFVTPKQGNFGREDLSIGSSNYKYDLIFVIGSPDLENIGNLYHDNADFFYKTTIINIDNDPANEHFGQINWVDLNAAACAEILFNLTKSLDENFIDEDIATNLLAGIILKSNNFKAPNITPKTLNIAAKLIALGAKKEIIISNLYNKTLPTLNLWGRVLARLKQDTHYKLAWSLVDQTDFKKSNANEKNLQGVVDELISNSPQIEIALIIYENADDKIAGQIYSSKNYNSLDIARPFNPIGTTNQSSFVLDTNNLIGAEQTIIDKIRERIIV